MKDLSQASLSDRTEEDIQASIDLDKKAPSIDVDELLRESAQRAMDESKASVSKTPVQKEEVNTIDYFMFTLPTDKEEYLAHVNQKNRRVIREEIKEGEQGCIILHLFSLITDIV